MRTKLKQARRSFTANDYSRTVNGLIDAREDIREISRTNPEITDDGLLESIEREDLESFRETEEEMCLWEKSQTLERDELEPSSGMLLRGRVASTERECFALM